MYEDDEVTNPARYADASELKIIDGDYQLICNSFCSTDGKCDGCGSPLDDGENCAVVIEDDVTGTFDVVTDEWENSFRNHHGKLMVAGHYYHLQNGDGNAIWNVAENDLRRVR